MKNVIYLLNISVSGIKCIKNEVRLNFYKKTVDKNFDPEKYRVKAVYGENGSGKSALVTAIKIFQNLFVNSNYLSESGTQSFLDEMVNKTTRTFWFECEFFINAKKHKAVYNYKVSLGKNKKGLYEIQSEILKSKKGGYANNNYQIVYETQSGKIQQISCNDITRGLIEEITANLLTTRPLASLIIANADKVVEIEAHHSDKCFLRAIIYESLLSLRIQIYLGEEDQHDWYFLRKRLRESGSDQDIFVEGLLGQGNAFHTVWGVNEKFVDKKNFGEYKDRVMRLTQFIKIFKPDLVSVEIDAKEDGEQYVCDLNLNYGDYQINKEFESTGIKKLIRLFDCLSFASTGGIVFVDEMDANLNDVYLCKLIEYFMYYGKGQLCFTTHNIGPMSVLKENKNSIDFLSSDNHLVPWTSRGNATPENCYRNGMIEDLPFNVDASDFVGIFGE